MRAPSSARGLRRPLRRLGLGTGAGVAGWVRTLARSLWLLAPSLLLPLPAAGADYVLLTFLHTNDLHGRVLTGGNLQDSSRGGLARAATLVRRIRQEVPNVLLFDVGDSLHGTPEEFLSQGQSIIRAMDTLGYDAATFGNHEFDWGQEAALAAIRQATFPYVSANVVDRRTGQPWGGSLPYLTKEVDGVRVAVFGLTTLETVALEWPPFISEVRFNDPFEAARSLVPHLREQADLVVCLSHLGFDKDAVLAATVPGIDIILGGHSHTRVSQRLRLGDTFIAQAGATADALGRMDVILKRGEDGRFRIRSVNGWGRWWNSLRYRPLDREWPTSAMVPLDADLTPDEDTVRAYEPYELRVVRERSRVVATAEEPITDAGAPGDTPIARLAAEAYRAEAAADVGISEGKARGSLGAGDVRAGQLWDILGGYTGQNVIKLEVTGQQLRAAIDQWAGLPGGLAIGTAGLRARVVSSRPSGQRVLELTVGGRPVLDGDTITVAGVMYVLRRFPPLMQGKLLDGNLGWTRRLLVRYAQALRSLRVPGEPNLVLESPAARPGRETEATAAAGAP